MSLSAPEGYHGTLGFALRRVVGKPKRPFRNCLSRVQPIEQGLGPLQVERVETFGEAAVDGGQKVVSFGGSPLMGPKFGERGGGSQFPELRLLLLCESDGRFEALFCLSAASGTL